MSAEARLKELGLSLPPQPRPMANYVSAVRTGSLLYLAGHGPLGDDGKPISRGKLGRDLTVEEGYRAARQTALNALVTLRTELGSLDRVRRIVKVLGMVNADQDFQKTPQVINGFSDLMVEVFGESIGKHARSAVGMATLPNSIPVEIESIFEVE
ncbi:MAG: RidA family protein [Deltaproteobacteria bacterium]|nr:RidA family protein [Deltaproteobacteria bacterium]